MVKEPEIIMINAATAALEYKTKHPRCWDDEAVKHALKVLDSQGFDSDSKILGVAAANEIMEMKKDNTNMADRQLLQVFVDNLYQFLSKIQEGNE